jgi:hypothetical protein
MTPQSPPRWTLERLQREASYAVEVFRDGRATEPLELYLELFEGSRVDVEDALEATLDLQLIQDDAKAMLSVKRYRDVIRYLAGPPISEDDLRNLAGKAVFAEASKGNQGSAERVLETLWPTLDRMRFPWVSENRDPTEIERYAAVLATTAMIATQRAQTARRNAAKVLQEERVKSALREIGFQEVETRTISTPSRAPKPGEFCGESSFVGKKADVVVGLWDERVMPIECKTSNSEVNSYKRVNHEAGGKATHWITKFGEALVVPAVTIAGVFNPKNLIDAQSAGLTIWWSHALDEMATWVGSTRP